MKQETRSILAIGLSLLVFVVWYHYFAPKQKPENLKKDAAQTETVAADKTNATADAATTTATTTGEKGTEAKIESIDPQRSVSVQTDTIETSLYKITFTNDGGVPVSWQMKNFSHVVDKKEIPVDLASSFVSPLLVSDASAAIEIPEKPRFKVVESGLGKIVYLWRSKDVEITKTYRFDPNTYLIELDVAVKNLKNNPINPSLDLSWGSYQPKEKNKGFFSFLKGPSNIVEPVYYMNGSAERKMDASQDGKLSWAGIEDRYFISAIIPRSQGADEAAKILAKTKPGPEDGKIITMSIISAPKSLIPNGEFLSKYSIYAGPKEINLLKAVGVNLDRAINYGWFSFIAYPMLKLLKFFYSLISNYGIAILLLTVFIKLLLTPLSRYSMKSMKEMQKLQPKLKELREKYKDNRERLNMETMQLFRTHKVNPMSGCLPMLIQLPIYIALYKVLWNSIELYRAPFFGFYKDLSAPDPYFIMPVLLGVAMWLQQKFTPSASADPSQAKMMQIMPIMFTAFMLFLPSGLVFYILINTVMGVVQQWMTNNDIRFRDLIRGRFKPHHAKA